MSNEKMQMREQLAPETIEKMVKYLTDMRQKKSYGGLVMANFFAHWHDTILALVASHQSANEQMKPLVELCEELLSIETADTIGGTWEATHLEYGAGSGDTVYQANKPKSELIEYKKRLRQILATIEQDNQNDPK